MATLVFDIETAALPLDHFDSSQREYLFRDAEQLETEAARDQRRAELERMMNLWPLTSQVVCVAMVNAESGRGKVLFLAEDADDGRPPEGGVEFLACMEESELLATFWDMAKYYEQVVTFNGRGFDVPFLYLRSAQLHVPISRKDWLGYRFATEPHCDLADQFSFYGVSGREGAARRFNLDFYCKAFGVASPKSGGVTGLDVASLIAEGRHLDVAAYCLRDVQATVSLFQIWKERLAGVK